MKKKLISIKTEKDIPQKYNSTPIAKLLQYHNLEIISGSHESAELLIIMCMDSRLMLKLPSKFSFIIRNSGARFKEVSFAVSFAIAVEGIRHIAVIGHTNCKMVNLESKREVFIQGLERYGWKRDEAKEHFLRQYPYFTKKDELDTILLEVKSIRSQFFGIVAAPLFYSLEDNRLHLIKENTLSYRIICNIKGQIFPMK